MNTYAPGSLINNRYEVASLPLMGGMGIVYLCMDHEEDRPVALKTFKPEYLPDRETRDRFLREGTIWIELGSHPHIVRCYGVERVENGSDVFLVLEQVAKELGREDPSLRSWLQLGRPLPVDQALLFALQIARGMKHATARIPGFVHRDLKPENVLVGADYITGTNINRLRVTDFGLVSVLKPDLAPPPSLQSQNVDFMKRTQLTHGIVGTPWYMSPEQWKGEPVSVATDVYALGCILYEMIIGQFAVIADSLEELGRKHCEGKISPVKVALSTDIAKLLITCLAPNPANRYADWNKAIAALEKSYQNITHKTVPVEETETDLSRAEQITLGSGFGNLGFSYMDIGRIEVALKYFERALSIAQELNSKVLEVNGLNAIGMSYAAMGDARSSIKYYVEALALSDQIDARSCQGAILSGLATAYKNLGDVERAIDYHEKALMIEREVGDRHSEGNSLIALGVAYKNLGDARRAIELYEQALVICRELKDKHMESDCLGNMGIAYKNLNAPEEAIACYEMAIRISREIGDLSGEGNSLLNLGNVYLLLNDTDRAIKFSMRALEICRETKSRHGEGLSLMNLGRAYLASGNWQSALQFLTLSEPIFIEVEYINDQAQVSFEISRILASTGNLTNALKKAQEAKRLWSQIGNSAMNSAQQLVEELNNLIKEQNPGFLGKLFGKKDARDDLEKLFRDGLNLLERKDFNEAGKYFQKTLDIALKTNNKLLEGNALVCLSAASWGLNDLDQAIQYRERALKISCEMGDKILEKEHLRYLPTKLGRP